LHRRIKKFSEFSFMMCCMRLLRLERNLLRLRRTAVRRLFVCLHFMNVGQLQLSSGNSAPNSGEKNHQTTKTWSVFLLNKKKYIYFYLKCIVYGKLLKPRQSFRITMYFIVLDSKTSRYMTMCFMFCSPCILV